MEIRPASRELWPLIADLFGTTSTLRWCWCQWWRKRNANWTNTTAEDNRADLEALVAREPAPGLVAIEDGRAVGWVGLGPRDDFPRLGASRVIPQLPGDAVWTVNCFVVARGSRRGGVAGALLEAAVAYARDHGAAVIEGYPTRDGRRQGFRAGPVHRDRGHVRAERVRGRGRDDLGCALRHAEDRHAPGAVKDVSRRRTSPRTDPRPRRSGRTAIPRSCSSSVLDPLGELVRRLERGRGGRGLCAVDDAGALRASGDLDAEGGEAEHSRQGMTGGRDIRTSPGGGARAGLTSSAQASATNESPVDVVAKPRAGSWSFAHRSANAAGVLGGGPQGAQPCTDCGTLVTGQLPTLRRSTP